MNILNLPSLRILDVIQTTRTYQIKAEMISQPSCCPRCGCAPNLQRFGHKTQLFLDLPMHGKQVGILVVRHRYRCKDCEHTFFQPLSDMDKRRALTKRALEYIEKEALRRTFASVAEEIGLDEKTIRNIFHDAVETLEKKVRFQTPEWLGLDEIHLIGKPRCIVTNVKERTVIELLRNRNKETLTRYLKELPDRQQVRFVCMDMWQPYRDAVKAILPQAVIVVDKFHVLRLANHCLDTVRKSIREKLTPKQRRALMHDRFILHRRRSELDTRQAILLEAWTGNLPLLGLAYDLKEQFYAIWESGGRTEALVRYQEWRQNVSDELRTAFQPLLTALSNWSEEVFAYFDHPLTNAYTESVNNLIRLANRVGRGYSFEAIRAKILHTDGLHKYSQPTYRKQRRDVAIPEDILRDSLSFMFVDAVALQKRNLGMDISTLSYYLEYGKL